MALTKITNDLLELGSDTGALGLPKGTTAQRPSNPVEGTLRHNSEIDETKLETFDGTDWRKINKIGGTSGVDYLIIAGGGGGGTNGGAGGGAGGYRNSYNNETSGGGSSSEESLSLESGTTYTIVIGAGGVIGERNPGGFNRPSGGPGNNSSFSNIISIGGGYGAVGGDTSAPGGPGGSGGGGSSYASFGGSTAHPGGFGTTGQGFNGGNSNSNGSNVFSSAGGGGAGSAGESSVGSYSGYGGSSLNSSITGSSIARAAGGNAYQNYTSLNGSTPSDQAGSSNSGSGGGQNANGGSGVVILRMPTSIYSGITTGSPTVTINGTDTILTYTSSGTYTA